MARWDERRLQACKRPEMSLKKVQGNLRAAILKRAGRTRESLPPQIEPNGLRKKGPIDLRSMGLRSSPNEQKGQLP